MVAGNSKLENEIGVANGFPNMDLKQDEIMLVKDVTDVLGLKQGDQVEISFDLFQSAVADLAKFKKILFNWESYRRQNKEFDKQSEALMSMFDIPRD